MKNLRKQLVLWKNEFVSGNFDNVLNEYKSFISEESLNDEVYAASYCLIALNAEVHKISKSNLQDSPPARVIFELVHIFCESVAKSWELVTVDFSAGVFYIFKYLLDRNHVSESLYVASRVFKYQTEHAARENSKNQPNVPYAMLVHLFSFTEKLQLTAQNVTRVNDLMMFLSENYIVGSTRDKLPAFLKYFSSFFLKSARSAVEDYVDLCSSVLKNLARSCHDEVAFMEMIRSVAPEVCELSLKGSKRLLLDCIESFKEPFGGSSPTCVDFCQNILRIAVRVPEDASFPENSCLSEVVARANRELQTLVKNQSPVLSSSVYFSTVVILKMHNWDSGECPFDVNCALQLFELLYTLAEQLYDINLNDFLRLEETPRKDICSCVYLCSFLLKFMEKIKGFEVDSPEACEYILKCGEIFRKCLERRHHLEKKKLQNILYFTSISCANVYYKLAEFELQGKYIELCSIVGPVFATLDKEELAIPNIQICLKKIVVNLCVSYRTTNSYMEALIASLAWSLILPDYSSTFMDVFGNLKQKLFSSSSAPEQSLYLSTSLDLLDHKKNTWQHERLRRVNSFDLLKAELEQYKKLNILSVKLAQNIIGAVRELKLSVEQKSVLYMMIGEILTNSNLPENVDFIKKFVKSIASLLNKFAAPIERGVTTLHALMGDLLYVKFRIELLIHRSENECELKSLCSSKKPLAAEPGMEPDFKEEGNITITNYVCLSAQTKLTKILDSAVDNWQTGFKNKSKLDLSHLKDTALIYRLYCDIRKEIDAWKLLYSAAIFVEDFTMAVYAYANLLTLPWEEEAEWRENVAELLPKCPDNIRLFYQLSYLNRRLIDGFDKEDEKTLLSLPQDALTKHNLWANYCFLMAVCQQRNLVKFSQHPHVLCFLAYSNLMSRTKNRKWNSLGECCEIQCLLFDVVLFLVSSDVQIYQVAEAKSYLKDPIDLILKLSLPFRICQYLNISVRIDTLTCSLDECYLKLQDICDILELKREERALLCKPSMPPPVLSPIMDSDFRADSSSRRFEFPSQAHIAPLWKFNLPGFMNHGRECNCDLCTSQEYSRLLCEVTALFGVYYRLAGKGADAVEFFEGANRINDIIKERFPSCKPLLLELVKIEIFVAFEQANYQAMVGNYNAASTHNLNALKLTKDKGLPVPQDCVEQCWAIRKAMELEKEKETKREARKATVRPNRLPVPAASAQLKLLGPKTPATRKTVSATPSRPQPLVFVDEEDTGPPPASAQITPYPPRQSRRALFGEFAEASVKATAKARRQPKDARTATPPDIVMQTPSVIEKRSRKLGERKNLFVAAAKPLAPANVSPAAGDALVSKVPRRRRLVARREKENQVAK